MLQAIKDIPIYSKIVRDLFIKNLRRKRKDPLIIKLVGKLSKTMSEMPSKYTDLRNPVVTIHINGISLPNTIVDLGAAINIIPMDIMQNLQLEGLRPT